MLDLNATQGTRLCDGISRRAAMQIGTLGTLGLGLPQLLAAEKSHAAEKPAGSTFGTAKRVIMLFMWGGPAHQDTWDLKPHGPVELRGEFLPIATNVPGMHISEHFPLIAQHADKLAIIRSVGQEDNRHSTGAHAGLTGRKHERQQENFGARDSDFPHYGSVLSKLRPSSGGLPTFVALPDVIATTAGAITPGQGGGILGRKYDPFQITDHPDEPGFSISSLTLPGGLTTSRMRNRRTLLSNIDRVARMADRSHHVEALGDFYQQALDMVLSPRARKAFDLNAVPETERWRYGWHTFGQSVLMAKRLVESGVKLVTVYWHREVKTIDTSWDTHSRNFTELRSRLMPVVDRAISALLADLQSSGMLEDTLVVWNSEFGRTPKINRNGGRDHWGPCNSVVMAGGGMPGGQIFGETDKAAAYPTKDKVTQDDIAATMYHLLGLNPHTLIHDRTNRPFPIALGKPIDKLLGEECRPAPTPNPPAIKGRPQYGRFHRMLQQRGRRFLCCEVANPAHRSEWELNGWSEVQGLGKARYRVPQSGANVQYTEVFTSHFDYRYVVLRLAKPHKLTDMKLSLGNRDVPLPAELRSSAARKLWHIPLPAGFVKPIKNLTIQLEASNLPVREIALVGDPIRPLHLRHFNV
ncbi:MAG: hypothetical protein Tsb009_30620 [Planctomycetaceae bacterium]